MTSTDRNTAEDSTEPTWVVYVIRCRDGTLYTGITTDVGRRFSEHVEGGPKGARYLKGRGLLQLEFQREVGNRSKALQIEYRVKSLSRSGKERLLRDTAFFDEVARRVNSAPP